MGEPEIEDLFLRFRDKGDANALAVVFDRTAGELLTLALHLAPESSAAEDLVQATFLAAIQGADSFERGRRVMPWLVGILANQGARARRDRARVVDPSRVEARPEPDPAHTTEQREVLATLTRAIDDLPDTCRESVRRHLLEGERAVDIARADGTAPGTVRMQILRGLDRLRRTLPASLLSIAPFTIEAAHMTTIRAAVLSAARSQIALSASTAGAGASSASTWSLASAIVGAFVTLKLCIAAVVLALIGLAAWRISESSVPPALAIQPRPSLTPSSIDAPGSPVVPERAAAATSAGAAGPSSTTGVAKTHNGWWLTGEVRGTAGLDASETIIRANGLPGSDGEVSGRASSSGRFELDVSQFFRGGEDPIPQYLVVWASHPAMRDANASVTVDPEKTAGGSTARVEWNVDLELEPYAMLAGHVDVASADAPQSTEVVLFQNVGTRTDSHWKNLSSTQRHADGSFELRVRGSGDGLLVAQAEGLVPDSTLVHFERGVRSEVGTLQLVRGEVSLEGRLELGFASGGMPRGVGASVRAHRPGAKSAFDQDLHGAHFAFERLGIGRVELDEQTAHVETDGNFRFHGLPVGEWELDLDLDDVVQLGSHSTKCVIPGPPVVLGAELDRWRMHCVSKGKPVADAALVATLGDQSPRTSTDEEGNVQLVAPFRTGFQLEASAPGFATKHVTIPPAMQALDGMLDVELALADDPRATLVLNVKDPSVAPETAQVTLVSIGADGDSIDKMFLDGRGPFELEGVSPGRWSVLVQPAAKAWFGMPGGSEVQDLRFEVVLAPHERHVETIAFEKGGRVDFAVEGWTGIRTGSGPWAQVHVRDASGQAVATSFVVRESQRVSLSLVSNDDKIALYAPSTLRASLPNGTYTIELDDKEWTGHAVQFQVKAGETTKVRVAVARR